MDLKLRNGIIFLIGLAVPHTAELCTATSEYLPGTGFDVLLYQPFDFAFITLMGVTFLVVNLIGRGGRSPYKSVGIGLIVWIVWFIVTFLAVGQLHITFGGKL